MKQAATFHNDNSGPCGSCFLDVDQAAFLICQFVKFGSVSRYVRSVPLVGSRWGVFALPGSLAPALVFSVGGAGPSVASLGVGYADGSGC